MSLTPTELTSLIANALNIQEKDIVHVGSGTYSYVFSISDTEVIKVYYSEKSFRLEFIDDPDYFEASEFRESFLNSYLDNKNLLKYNTIKYHEKLGLYKIAHRMSGSIDKAQFCKLINENLFFCLLEDMISAISHLHSYGIIHSDIKPSNILFSQNSISGQFYFKLCDFNISQFCSAVHHDIYPVFATPNYSNNKENRSIMTDIFMLGTTLLAVVLNKNNISISDDPININILTKYKNIVIKNTSQLCYDIMVLMMLPQKKRVYLSTIQKYIDRYNLDEYHPDKNTEIFVDHSVQRFESNNREMQELCHTRIKSTYRPLHQMNWKNSKTYTALSLYLGKQL